LKKQNDTLKIIAILTMLIDHIGMMFYPQELIFRMIGRLAFPIFAYYCVLGVIRTSNFSRYLTRIVVVGLFTQVPYTYFNRLLIPRPLRLNIMFSLFLIALLIWVLENVKSSLGKSVFAGMILALPLLLEGYLAIDISYGTYGLLLSLGLYMFVKDKVTLGILMLLFATAWYGVERVISSYYIVANMALVDVIKHYIVNGKFLNYTSLQSIALGGVLVIKSPPAIEIPKMPKWLSYGFYPLHMILLIVIKWYQLGGQ